MGPKVVAVLAVGALLLFSASLASATPPNTTITGGPGGDTNNPTPTFRFTSSTPGSTFACRVDSSPYADCTSPHTTPPLADGPHTFYARATDPAGDVDPTPAKRSFRVVPQTTIVAGPADPTNNPTPTFSFSSSVQGSSFECSVDGNAYASCASPKTTAELAEGAHSFSVRAIDPAGYVDATPAERSFTVQLAPNVLVIETDDQTVESMRVMQNVNALIGAQGATFTNSFVNYSLCCPSRSTFLTGQYAHNHGVLGNAPPDGGGERFASLHGGDNLAVWLKKAGYYTALIGKYLRARGDDPGVPPGWSEWHEALVGYGVYNYPTNDGGTLNEHGSAPGDFKQDVLTTKAVNFVNRRAGNPKPFFLWLTYSAPHWSPPDPNPNPPYNCGHAAKPAPRHAHAFDSEPLPTPPSLNEADVSDKQAAIGALPQLSENQIADVRRKYRCELESLLSVDEGVKELLDKLEAKGALDDTLVIYTSDNGYFHGEHRIPPGKMRIYEESIRVPLLIRGPGVPAGVAVDPLAINADLAPTIVEVASAARPGLTMDGRPLIPLAQQPEIERGRELLIEEPGVLVDTAWGPGFEAIRTERYVYAEFITGETELYDLQSDPFELQSLHTDPAFDEVEAELADHLHQLQSCVGASCLLHSAP
jgi:arylsulfatase A-like enzyme